MIMAKVIRNQRGIKAKFVANNVLQITPAYLSMIEAGKAPMPPLVQNRLSRFYNVAPKILTKAVAKGGQDYGSIYQTVCIN